MEQTPVPMHRLLKRQAVAGLLESFAPLLPGVTIALADTDGRVYVEAHCPVEEEAIASSEQRTFPLHAIGQTIGTLVVTGPALDRPEVKACLDSLHRGLTLILNRALENRSLAQETLERYRELNLLYNIGETISASLDPDEVPRLVLAEACRVIRADVGSVLLLDDQGTLVARSDFGGTNHLAALYAIIHSYSTEVLQEGRTRILTPHQLATHPSPMSAVLCAPLKTKERALGIISLGRLEGQPMFTASDKKLLTALEMQASTAIENAHLFANVKRQRDAIAAMKNYMDNIFASIASGVITTDNQGLITTLNRAAERILAVREEEPVGRPYFEVFPVLRGEIISLVNVVMRLEEAVTGYELESDVPSRGRVVLRLHISPLKDNRQNTTGVAIVMEDLTEQRHLEQQVRQVRRTFERYVVPHVVEQLLSDPTRVRLGGVRRDATILFADLRGFTAFGENLEPESVVKVLNRHLTLAAEAVLAEEGMLDKFIGDAVMAVFNAPLSQPDHTLRGVRTAVAMQQAIAEMHDRVPHTERLSFGIGISTGPVVVGNIGSPTIHNYTAIGDSVNLAWRLHKRAGPGQILLDAITYECVQQHVLARELGHVQLKGHTKPDLVFEVLELRE